MAKAYVKKRELEYLARKIEFTADEMKKLFDSEFRKLTKELTDNQVRNIQAGIQHLKGKIKQTENEVKANDSMLSYFKSTVRTPLLSNARSNVNPSLR